MADVAAMSTRIERLCDGIVSTCDAASPQGGKLDRVSRDLLEGWQRELLLLVRELQSRRHRVELDVQSLPTVPRADRYRAAQSARDRSTRLDALIASANRAIATMLPLLVTNPKAPHPLIELLDKLDEMRDFNAALFGPDARADCKKYFESMTVHPTGSGTTLKADPRSGFQPDLAAAMTTVLVLVRLLILRRERQNNRT